MRFRRMASSDATAPSLQRHPGDLRRFRRVTMGAAVIMGRTTFAHRSASHCQGGEISW